MPSASAISSHSLSFTTRCVACSNKREGVGTEWREVQEHMRARIAAPAAPPPSIAANRHFELQEQDVAGLKFERRASAAGNRAVRAGNDGDDVLAGCASTRISATPVGSSTARTARRSTPPASSKLSARRRELVLADRPDHANGSAGARRRKRLVRSLAAGRGRERVSGHRLARAAEAFRRRRSDRD